MSSSLFSNLNSKEKIFSSKKTENKNDLIIEKSITYYTRPKLMNKSLINIRQLYDNKKLNQQKFKTYNRKNSVEIKPEKLILKKKYVSMTNTQSKNTSFTLKNTNNNSYSINNENQTNKDKFFKIRINLLKRKNDNMINNEKKKGYITSHWRSMSIGFDDFNLSNKKIDYSIYLENENYLKKIVLIQSFIRRFLIRNLVFNQLIKYYKQKSGILNLKSILLGILKNIFLMVIELIELRKDAKYYLNYKEYELLIELHKRKIYSKNDWIIYFNKLIKGNLITENKNIKKKK